jgi:hypothetical protein
MYRPTKTMNKNQSLQVFLAIALTFLFLTSISSAAAVPSLEEVYRTARAGDLQRADGMTREASCRTLNESHRAFPSSIRGRLPASSIGCGCHRNLRREIQLGRRGPGFYWRAGLVSWRFAGWRAVKTAVSSRALILLQIPHPLVMGMERILSLMEVVDCGVPFSAVSALVRERPRADTR